MLLSTNVWSLIVSHLEWPERLAIRVVCKELYAKQQGLHIDVINEMIIAELLPFSKPSSLHYSDPEMLYHYCSTECPITTHKLPLHTPPKSFVHHLRYATRYKYYSENGERVSYPFYKGSILYENAVRTVGELSDPVEEEQDASDAMICFLNGSTSLVRAVHIRKKGKK